MKVLLPAVILALCVAALSCRKDNSPKPSPTPGIITINLNFLDNIDSLHQDMWELLVSEPGGKLLLDTVTRVNMTVSATLKTSADRVNLTTVFHSAVYGYYSVTSFLGVNPSSWTTPNSPLNYYYNVPVDTLPSVMDTMYFIHPPALSNSNPPQLGVNPVFASDYTVMSEYGAIAYSPTDSRFQPGGLLTVSYLHHGNNPVYFLLPQLSLYNFHQPKAGGDTVDLTHMDTAVMLHYTVPPPYTIGSNILYGYTDTTNFDKSMQLFFNIYSVPLPADVEYPKTGVQTYQLTSTAYSSLTKEFLNFYSYGRTVPASLPFPPGDAYAIHSNQPDSFSVTFPAITPTAWFAIWKAGTVALQIIAPADSTLIHPSSWLSHLGSKMLNGQTIGTLTATQFNYQLAAGMDYAGELNYFCTPADIKTRRLSTVTTYLKGF